MEIYLDIETIPGQAPDLKARIAEDITHPATMKKPETIARWEEEQKPAAVETAWRKTAFQGDVGELVCVGWAIDDGSTDCWFRTPPHIDGPNNNVTEAALLQCVFQHLHRAQQRAGGRVPVFIGHNVRDFDLRFLYQRAVILGVRPLVPLPHDARPNSPHVYDTMTAWAGWGGRIALDRLCAALGIPTKGSEVDADIDGARVWDFVRDGRILEVAEYCKGDVDRVRRVHARLNFSDADPCPTNGARRASGQTLRIGPPASSTAPYSYR